MTTHLATEITSQPKYRHLATEIAFKPKYRHHTTEITSQPEYRHLATEIASQVEYRRRTAEFTGRGSWPERGQWVTVAGCGVRGVDARSSGVPRPAEVRGLAAGPEPGRPRHLVRSVILGQ